MYKTCKINGKDVKLLRINGKTVYSSLPDAGKYVNDYAALSCGLGSPTKLGESSYTYNGQTYNYSVYDTITMNTDIVFATRGAGNDCPWFVAPDIVATAAHWAGSLKTGSWTGANGYGYSVSAWTNLKDWALENGWTEDQLKGMAALNDIVVAKTTGDTVSSDSCPYFIKKETVDKYFWSKTLRGVVGFHAPQPDWDFPEYDEGAGWVGTVAAPVVFGANYAWNTPKVNYTTMDSRSETLKATLSALDPTYLAYVGDSGKPTWFMFGDKPVVVSQCYTQFAGPDFTACFDVLKAYVEAQESTLKELTPEMIETALTA